MIYPEVFVNKETAEQVDLQEVYPDPVIGVVFDVSVNFE